MFSRSSSLFLLAFFLFFQCFLFGVYGQCDDCMDGMPMQGCPSPTFCGFAPFDCSVCVPIKTDNCTARLSRWCATVTCNNCMNSMPMNGCPDPGLCGYKPIACKGCVFGKSMPGCPRPDWCGNYTSGTPPCYDCMDGMVMPQCPDPHKCGFKPACEDCMAGMGMPNCPDPDACAAAGMSSGCVMQMYFNLDESACILVKKWDVSAKGEWALAVIMIIIAAFAREGIAFYRSYRLFARKRAKAQTKAKHSQVDNPELKDSLLKDNVATLIPSTPSSTPWYSFAIDSFCYCLQHTLSYLLMLVIMTYNFYLFIAVILAFTIAHFSINYAWAQLKAKTADLSRTNQSINGKSDGGDGGGARITIGAKTGNDDPEQKTGGDHCCEDFEFDD